jgi:DNA-binding transcriptional LysR family regulator
LAPSDSQLYYKNNRLKQLRAFYQVVRCGSISKAAEKLFLSQPSVSFQIQALEREMEVILFERRGPHLKLTPEGEVLFQLAEPLVDGIDKLAGNLFGAFRQDGIRRTENRRRRIDHSVHHAGAGTPLLSRPTPRCN